MNYVIQNITSLKTRHLTEIIETRNTWDNKINILRHKNACDEILFWLNNVNELNLRNFCTKDSFSYDYIVNSDASNIAVGIIVDNKMPCHQNLRDEDKLKSSTRREVYPVLFGLQVFEQVFKGKRILWHTDNAATPIVIKRGSRRSDLQALAICIYRLISFASIHLDLRWVPREENVRADSASKYVDPDDWEISDDMFSELNGTWGPYTVDRFANVYNRKLLYIDNNNLNCSNSSFARVSFMT